MDTLEDELNQVMQSQISSIGDQDEQIRKEIENLLQIDELNDQGETSRRTMLAMLNTDENAQAFSDIVPEDYTKELDQLCATSSSEELQGLCDSIDTQDFHSLCPSQEQLNSHDKETHQNGPSFGNASVQTSFGINNQRRLQFTLLEHLQDTVNVDLMKLRLKAQEKKIPQTSFVYDVSGKFLPKDARELQIKNGLKEWLMITVPKKNTMKIQPVVLDQNDKNNLSSNKVTTNPYVTAFSLPRFLANKQINNKQFSANKSIFINKQICEQENKLLVENVQRKPLAVKRKWESSTIKCSFDNKKNKEVSALTDNKEPSGNISQNEPLGNTSQKGHSAINRKTEALTNIIQGKPLANNIPIEPEATSRQTETVEKNSDKEFPLNVSNKESLENKIANIISVVENKFEHEANKNNKKSSTNKRYKQPLGNKIRKALTTVNNNIHNKEQLGSSCLQKASTNQNIEQPLDKMTQKEPASNSSQNKSSNKKCQEGTSDNKINNVLSSIKNKTAILLNKKSEESKQKLPDNEITNIPSDEKIIKVVLQKITCFYCQGKYITLRTLKKHIQTMHLTRTGEFSAKPRTCIIKKKKQLLSCSQCKFKTYKSSTLKMHILSKHKGLTKCPNCKYKTRDSKELHLHIVETHYEKNYECKECDYKTNQQTNFKRHVHAWHSKQKPFKCLECDFSASQSNNLKSHMVIWHGTASKIYYCQYCDYKSKRSARIREHTVSKHSQVKSYDCEQCSYRTTEAEKLKVHVLSRHNTKKDDLTLIEAGRHHCSQCGYSTHHTGHLKTHMMAKHSTKRPHHCDLCKFKTVRKRDLNRHIRRVHTKETPKVVPVAVLTESRSTDVQVVQDKLQPILEKAKHNETSVLPEEPAAISLNTTEIPVGCKAIGPEVAAVVAESEKPSIAFVASKHSTKRPHQCDFCKFKTVRKRELNSHIRRMHNKEPPKVDAVAVLTEPTSTDLQVVQDKLQPFEEKAKHNETSVLSEEPAAISFDTTEIPAGCTAIVAEVPAVVAESEKPSIALVASKNSTKRPHQCDFCKFKTVRKRELNSHIRRMHSKESPKVAPVAVLTEPTSTDVQVVQDKLQLFTKKAKYNEIPVLSEEAAVKSFDTADIPAAFKAVGAEAPAFVAESQKPSIAFVGSKPSIKGPHQCDFCKFKTVRKRELNSHIRRMHSKESPKVTAVAVLTEPKSTDIQVVQDKLQPILEKEKHNETSVLPEEPAALSFDTTEIPAGCTAIGAEVAAVVAESKKPSIAFVASKHSTKRPHQCDFCKFKTVRKRDLQRHITRMHSKESPKVAPVAVLTESTSTDLQVVQDKLQPFVENANYIQTSDLPVELTAISFDTAQIPTGCKAIGAEVPAVVAESKKPSIAFVASKCSTKRPHHCDFCKFKTVRKRDLNSHLRRMHSKVTPVAVSTEPTSTDLQVVQDKLQPFIEKAKYNETFDLSEEAAVILFDTAEIPAGFKAIGAEVPGVVAESEKPSKALVASKNLTKGPHQCDFCKFKTVRKRELNSHIRRMHSKESPKVAPVPVLTEPTSTDVQVVQDKLQPFVENSKYNETSDLPVEPAAISFDTAQIPAGCKTIGAEVPTVTAESEKPSIAFVASKCSTKRPHHCDFCIFKTVRKRDLNSHVRRMHSKVTPVDVLIEPISTDLQVVQDKLQPFIENAKYNETSDLSVDPAAMSFDTTQIPAGCKAIGTEVPAVAVESEKPSIAFVASKCLTKRPHHCGFCKFKTVRKRDLNRHIRRMHSKKSPKLAPVAVLTESRSTDVQVVQDKLQPILEKEKHNETSVLPEEPAAISFDTTEIPAGCTAIAAEVPAVVTKSEKPSIALVASKNSTKRPHQCDFCKFKTVRKRELNSHIRRMHSKESPKVAPVPVLTEPTSTDVQVVQDKLQPFVENSKYNETSDLPVEPAAISFDTAQIPAGCKAIGTEVPAVAVESEKPSIAFVASKCSTKRPHHCDFCKFKTVRKRDLNRHVRRMHSKESPKLAPVAVSTEPTLIDVQVVQDKLQPFVENSMYNETSDLPVEPAAIPAGFKAIRGIRKIHQCQYPKCKSKRISRVSEHSVTRYSKSKSNVYQTAQGRQLKDLHLGGNNNNKLKTQKVLEKKRHYCSECNYSTHHTGHLRNHIMAKHLQFKPYQCKYCKFRMVRKINLKRHIKNKHKKRPVLPTVVTENLLAAPSTVLFIVADVPDHANVSAEAPTIFSQSQSFIASTAPTFLLADIAAQTEVFERGPLEVVNDEEVIMAQKSGADIPAILLSESAVPVDEFSDIDCDQSPVILGCPPISPETSSILVDLQSGGDANMTCGVEFEPLPNIIFDDDSLGLTNDAASLLFEVHGIIGCENSDLETDPTNVLGDIDIGDILVEPQGVIVDTKAFDREKIPNGFSLQPAVITKDLTEVPIILAQPRDVVAQCTVAKCDRTL